MTLRIAFAGFQHGHAFDMYETAGRRRDVEIVAACDEDAATREKLESGGKVNLTHADYDEMWRQADFDALAVCECFGRRGEITIRALSAGKHVISDKPICTKIEELDRIAELADDEGLSVGCQLPIMRESGNFLALREVIRSGRIGEVHTVNFTGQHPLSLGARPRWYFRPGLHGGTINDLAVHALDGIPFVTGRRIVSIVAARAWNARVSDPDWFQDGAQLMLRLDNDGGVTGDVSYLTPDNFAYNVPCYWRMTVHGGDGLAETSEKDDGVMLYSPESDAPQKIPPAKPRKGKYMEDFVNEIQGQGGDDSITTARVLSVARQALLAQQAADENLHDLDCG